MKIVLYDVHLSVCLDLGWEKDEKPTKEEIKSALAQNLVAWLDTKFDGCAEGYDERGKALEASIIGFDVLEESEG